MMADRDSYTYRNKSYCMVRTNGVPFLSRYIHLIANFSDHVGIHMQQTPYVKGRIYSCQVGLNNIMEDVNIKSRLNL